MLKPLNDYVVLSFEKEVNETKSGILLSTETKDDQSFGVVEAVGPKVNDLKKGDKVIYKSYSGTKTTLNDVEYLIIKEENILAIFN